MSIFKTIKQRLLFLLLFSTSIYFSGSAQDSLKANEDGLYGGLSFGTWFPDNANKILGSPLLFGPMLAFKIGKNTFGFTFDLIGWPKHTTKEPFHVKFRDSVIVHDEFYGGHISFDYSRELWSKRKFSAEGTAGIGYGDVSYYNPNKDINVGKSSLIFNPGLSLKYRLNKKVFFQIKVQYCLADYSMHDNVSTDFKGNYLTTKFIIGQPPKYR